MTQALRALHARLDEVAPVLVPTRTDRPPLDEDAGADEVAAAVGELIEALIAPLSRDPAADRVWLLLTALSGVYPSAAEVRATARYLRMHGTAHASTWVLHRAEATIRVRGRPEARLSLRQEAVLVDVDFSAKHDLHTGIQRTVRELLPRWDASHDVTLVAWTTSRSAHRSLDPTETDRVLRWAARGSGTEGPVRTDTRLIVPWRSTLVLPEVPLPDVATALAGLAELSGNRVVVVGYDCIPVASAELVPPAEAEKFTRYLSLVKHSHHVAAISRTAAAEFEGFVSMLPAQGLSGPTVSACGLPVQSPSPRRPAQAVQGREVLAVGSLDPRKNHATVLRAAEVLWSDGEQFELRFVGTSGWSTTDFDTELAAARARGRRVHVARRVDDEELWTLYASARFTVFCSLHEGFGLPVAESLAAGTPVVTSNFGSMAEIASDGGVLLADPHDEFSVAGAMRRLLDDDELERLRTQAERRPSRTWDDYADELWAATTGGAT